MARTRKIRVRLLLPGARARRARSGVRCRARLSPGAWAGTAATNRGGWGGRRIASLILAKLILNPSPGVEEVDLSGGDGEAPEPHGEGSVASSSAAPAGSRWAMRGGRRGSRGRYGTCAAAALIDLRETGASRGGGWCSTAKEVLSYGLIDGRILEGISIQGGSAELTTIHAAP